MPPGGGSATPTLERSDSEPIPIPISLGPLGLVGAIDIWIIPGLLIGTPGLLLVAFVLLQAAGALAWLPAIRRLRGTDPVSG
ncbi:MAG TPA: hypothetical protein VM253_11530 [Candidatus Limnocylindrales bacterium]|nr:hypothetical protein [Candidatus Limnocylindrales bacterium]